jgi:hypothetical protein
MIPAGLLVAGISGEMMMPQRLPMMTRLVGSNSRVCMTAVPLMSLPLLAASLIGLRHGAPARPAVSGAVAGLMSAGLAATLYASHAPTTRRCLSRPGIRSQPRSSPPSARWWARKCCGISRAR